MQSSNINKPSILSLDYCFFRHVRISENVNIVNAKKNDDIAVIRAKKVTPNWKKPPNTPMIRTNQPVIANRSSKAKPLLELILPSATF